MKKTLALILALILLLSSVPITAAARRAQTPQIVETVYPTDDVVVADIVATEAPYSADCTGENDVSAAQTYLYAGTPCQRWDVVVSCKRPEGEGGEHP